MSLTSLRYLLGLGFHTIGQVRRSTALNDIPEATGKKPAVNSTPSLVLHLSPCSSARNVLKKIRTAMAHRDSIYRLQNLIEFDDAFLGGKRTSKRGRGAQGKKPVLIAVETRTKGAGFVAMQAVNTVSQKTVRDFLKFNLIKGQNVRTGPFSALNAVAENHFHEKKVTPPEESPSLCGKCPISHQI
jgi:hypothetical protein